MVRTSEDHHSHIIFGRALGSVRGDCVQEGRPDGAQVASEEAGRHLRQTCAWQGNEAVLWRLGQAIG